MNEKLRELAISLVAAKAAEARAKAERLEIEAAIQVEVRNQKPEGQVTRNLDGFSVSVKNSVTRKLDFDRYRKLRGSIPKEWRFVKSKPALDLVAYREALAGPEDVRRVALECVAEIPAKAAVTVREI